MVLVLALLMLDIDHFQSINDRFGHQRGDEVLVEFARRVTGGVRDIDTFARYGGEGPEGGVRLTVSIGVACFPSTPPSPKS